VVQAPLAHPGGLGSGGPPLSSQAPVGHRQPRAADLPRNVPPDPFDLRLQQENRKLDRDLRLCRGC
jgi:hypothetical protein